MINVGAGKMWLVFIHAFIRSEECAYHHRISILITQIYYIKNVLLANKNETSCVCDLVSAKNVFISNETDMPQLFYRFVCE